MERDCGQKGSYNKADVIALGSDAQHGQAGKSSCKNAPGFSHSH